MGFPPPGRLMASLLAPVLGSARYLNPAPSAPQRKRLEVRPKRRRNTLRPIVVVQEERESEPSLVIQFGFYRKGAPCPV